MPPEVLWAVFPPALAAACVLLLDWRWSTRAGPHAARSWRRAVGPAAAVAAGYVTGHWGVTGIRWALGEALVPWLVVGALVVEVAGAALPERLRIVAWMARAAACGGAAFAVLAGAAVVEAKLVPSLILAAALFGAWALAVAASAAAPGRFDGWPPVIAAVAASAVLLFARSLKLALLAGALASALGAVALLGSIRPRPLASAQGPLVMAYGGLAACGWFFAELSTWPAVLLAAVLLVPALSRPCAPRWAPLVLAAAIAAAAVAISWAPPVE